MEKNYCVFCGEEIPTQEVTCGVCDLLIDHLTVDECHAISELQANAEFRAALHDAVRVIKGPIVRAVQDFVEQMVPIIARLTAILYANREE